MSTLSTLTDEQRTRLLVLVADLARGGDAAELAQFLDHGVSVDSVDAAGNTLLMLAAYHGRVEAVRLLLERGADPDHCNARGQSPIAGAIFKGEREIVALLLAAGADLDTGTPSAREAAAMFGYHL